MGMDMQQVLARRARGQAADRRGREAEQRVEEVLVGDGWRVLARRLRTAAGEIDLVAERDGLAAMIEVKARRSLSAAAYSVQARQQGRMMAAAEIALAEHPAWGPAGIRFDVMVVDGGGRVRRVVDAFRLEGA